MSDDQPPAGTWSEPEGWTPPEVTRPRTILWAVRLMWLGAVLSVLGIPLTLLQRDAIRDFVEESDESLSPNELDTQVDFIIISSIVIGVVATGLWIWMAITNGEGKPWARTVATVLGGLNVAFTLLGFVQGTTALSVVLGLLGIALAATILWLLYRPESNRFYDAHTPR